MAHDSPGLAVDPRDPGVPRPVIPDSSRPPAFRPRPRFASFLAQLRHAPKAALRWLLLGGTHPDYFRPAVRWLFGRDLIGSVGPIALYTAFGDELDHRDWMHSELLDLRDEPCEEDGFWFDYIADTGDGQLAMYNMASQLLADLYVDAPVAGTAVNRDAGALRLPRGRFLFIGGDTAYHVADAHTLEERMCAPFHWAQRESLKHDPVGAPPRWVLGIPGNHDYYDSLIGFNRLFRAPDNERFPLADYRRRQQASFVACKLPFDYVFLGMDSQSGKLDRRQRELMKQWLEEHGTQRLITATPEPATVFGTVKREATRPYDVLGLTRPFGRRPTTTGFPADDALHLDLAGDVHHYARYADPQHPNYAYVIAGGGGAFVHPTHTSQRDPRTSPERWPPPAAKLYPEPEESRRVITARLLCPWRILTGGSVFWMGGLLALLLYFGVALAPGMHELFVEDVLRHLPDNSHASPENGWQLSQAASSLKQVVTGARATASFARGLLPADVVTLVLVALVLLWARVQSPRWFAAARSRSKDRRRNASARRYLPLSAAAVLTLIAMVVSYVERVTDPSFEPPRPFVATFLLLFYLVPLPLSIVWFVNYLATLPKLAKVRELKRFDSVPQWVALAFGLGSALFGLLNYGINSLTAFAADFGALAALVCLVALPVGLGFSQGQAGRSWQRLGYAALGGIFGLLELMCPLLLAIYGGFWQLLACLAVAVSACYIAHRVYCRWSSPYWLLAIWLAAGSGTLALALGTAELRPVSGASFLLAFLAGGTFACVWFGLYLAVALGFNGHYNEAGGAARADFYRHFVRLKLTADRITGYVIGFDRPALTVASEAPTEARPLAVKLVDVFEIKRRG
ncbi:MAG: hypothetical protein ABW321_31805 [Polyangiales bacterium]